MCALRSLPVSVQDQNHHCVLNVWILNTVGNQVDSRPNAGHKGEDSPGVLVVTAMVDCSYLVLWVSCTDEKQLQSPQVPHPLTRSPDRGLQEGLTQFSEDPAVVQHPEDTSQTHVTDDIALPRQHHSSGSGCSLVQVFSGHGHVIGRLQRHHALEQLQC